MKIVSELSDKCKKCPYVNDCDEKRMVACGMMEFANYGYTFVIGNNKPAFC